MRTMPVLVLVLIALNADVASAQQPREGLPAQTPALITEGSANVSIGGQSATRKDDRTDGGAPIAEGSSNVFINGKPAVTTGDRTGCGGIVVGGGGGVFINGKPAARTGDLTTGCPGK